MAEFILTGFGDEIDASLDRQMEVMDGLGIHFIETRGIDGKNIADYTPEEAGAIHARMADRGFGVSALGSPVGKIGIHDDFAPHLERLQAPDRSSTRDADEVHPPVFLLHSGK